MDNYEEKFKDVDIHNDLSLLNVLCASSDMLSLEEKVYFVNKYQYALDEMDIKFFLRALVVCDGVFLQKIDPYIKKRVLSLSISQVEGLIYTNKYYRKVSDISTYLLKQPWFKDFKEKHKLFETAYNLEKLVKKNDVDLETLKEYGKVLIESISKVDSNPVTFDMALKNYVKLLKSSNYEEFKEFKKSGYIALNKQISNDEVLTDNALIFDGRMTIDEKSLNFVEFVEIGATNKKAVASFNGDSFSISPQRKREIYGRHNNKMAGELFLFVIGHELYHAYCEYYRRPKTLNYDDLLNELNVYNSGIGDAVSQLNYDFYHEYHSCFSHEYIANINGLKHMYEVQSYFPYIDKSAMEESTQYIADVLRHGYCLIRKTSRYISPIEFSKKFFQERDNVPKYALMHLLNGTIEMPKELVDVEANLTEIEKFERGYFNKYIGALDLIRSGKVKSTNLFNDLPIIYEQYKDSPEMKEYPHHVEERDKMARAI